VSVKKNSEEVACLRRAGKLLSKCLDLLVEAAKPGVSGLELDILAETFIRDNGAVPAFKGYGSASKPFPGSICFSRNHVIVHGVPKKEDVIKDGDVITIDCGLELDGWFADAARLFGVGSISQKDQLMMDFSKQALQSGIDACVVGNKLGDVSYAIQKSIVKSPFYNVYQFCGHAIGRRMHEDPQVPNFGRPGEGITLEPGMVFCLEPILLCNKDTKVQFIKEDGWTIVTSDLSNATHVEHMVLVTEGQPEILSDK
jgi:methionyl aminopeptidase